jgi:cell division septation protein DedD
LITAADAAPPATAPNVVPTPPAKVAVRAVDPIVATPEAATPKLDLPTKLSPKSQQRVIAKTDTTAPNADASATPSAPQQLVASPKPKPVKPAPKTVAEASVADSPPADAAPAAAAAPIVTASAPIAPAPAAAEGGGGWAVQLAAPRSEADAHSAVAKLKSKYADALGDSALSIHQADVKGQTIYRVRVSGLSKADAGALCSKLKAGGGDCFIAKD